MPEDIFDSFSKELREVISEFGYFTPTPIQRALLEIFRKNIHENLLVVAPTGSGKTEAIVFPVVDWLIKNGDSCKKCIKVLYITPLRALNRDIFNRLVRILQEKLGITIDIRHGDTPSYKRLKQSRNPPLFLITTPETLQAVLVSPNLRKALRKLRWVIVDEVHSLFDSKRGVQLSVALERLRKVSEEGFTVIGLSATVSNKEEVLSYLTGGRNGRVVEVGDLKRYDIVIDSVIRVDREGENNNFMTVDVHGIVKKIASYLNNNPGKVLVFTNTRDLAEIIGLLLKKYTKQPYAVHHSSLSREVRVNVEKEFKEGNLKCVIATSSLELGIDIGEVDLVIQVMSPRRVETLLQRVGRSGHGYKRVSKGVIITATTDDLLEAIAISNLSQKGFIEPIAFFEKNYDVLSHQIVGIVRDYYLDGIRGVSPREIFNLIKNAYPYRDLSWEEFNQVLDFLDKRSRVIRLEGGIVKLTRRSLRYYFENLSTIPSPVKYRVVDISERRKRIGELDSKFVLEINKGDVFLLAGVPREVIEVNSIEKEVVVISSSLEGKPPAWVGELLPVSLEVGLEVGSLREKIMENYEKALSEISKFLTDDSMELLYESRKLYRRDRPIPSNKVILMEIDGLEGVVVLHTPFGNKVNNTIATILAWFIVETNNLPYISYENDAYRIILKFDRNLILNKHFIEKILEEAINRIIDLFILDRKGERVEEVLKEAIIEFRINELAWYFINVMKRFGLVRDESSLTKKQILRLVSSYRDTVVLEEAIRELIQSKMDIKGARKIMYDIENGKIETWVAEELSPISLQGNAYSNVVVKDVNRYVEEIYEKTLLNRELKAVCLLCRFEVIEKVSNLPKICPKCGSSKLTITKKWDDVNSLLNKVSNNGASREDLDKLNDLITMSKYYSVYGKVAALPLAARGVGLKQALSILRRYASSKSMVIHHARKIEINYMKSKPIIEKRYI